MKKARALSKKSAALLLGGVMSLSCMTGAMISAFGKQSASAASGIVNVDASMQYQTFDGWGTSLCWGANEIGDWTRESAYGTTQRDYIMKLLFSSQGLNFNIARYNLGGGDDPTHDHLSFENDMPSFWTGKDESYDFLNDDGSDKDWSETVDARQLWVLDAFQKMRQEEAGEGNESDAITEFFSNSPPYWMTYSQCNAGSTDGKSDNLKPEHYEDYANFFVDSFDYLIRQGFVVDLLQPFNESGASNWVAFGDQEGCHFDAATKTKVLALIIKKLQDKGYSVGLSATGDKTVGYNWGDECNTGTAVNEYNSAWSSAGGSGMSGADVLTNANKVTYHIYDYSTDKTQELYRKAKSLGQKVEMSEITWTVSGTYDPDSMDTALQKYSQSIIDVVKYGGVDSFVFWQPIESLTGQIKTGWNYGFLHGVFDNPDRPSTVSGYDLASRGLTYQDVRTCKTYYTIGQYTKHIQPGYHIVEASDSRSIAAISPDGKTLIVIKENNSASSADMSFNLKHFNAKNITKVYTDETHDWASESLSATGSNFTDTVSPYSVTTYIITNDDTQVGSAYIIDDSAAKSVDSLDAMKQAITAAAETDAIYTVGYGNGGNSTGDFGGATHYATASSYLALHFYGTGFGILGMTKGDSGALKIWIDKDLTAEPTVTTGSLVTASTVYKSQVYRNNTLTVGWHTVFVQVKDSGTYFNLDGVFLINGQDVATEEKNVPVITDVAGKDGKIYLSFDGVEEASSYTAQYRAVGTSEWTDAGNVTSGSSFDVTDNATQYELRVGAGDPVAYSLVVKLNMNYSPDGLAYYVDIGTSVLTDGGWGRMYGTGQSTFDQAYGEDGVTGYSWGYTKRGTPGWSDEDPFSSICYGGESTTEYKFTMPATASYTVTVGTFRPEGWGNRTVGISITNGDKSITGSVESKDSTATIEAIDIGSVNKGSEITVTLSKADGVSLLIITETGKPIPVMAEGKSNYTMNGDYDHTGITSNGTIYLGEDFSAKDNVAEMNIVMSDGTKLATSVSGGTLEHKESSLSKLAAGEYYSIKYLVKGSDWNDRWPEMTVIPTYLIETKAIITQEYKVLEDEILYFNIDVGSDGTNGTFERGSCQTSDTRDQKYSGTNGWGYVNAHDSGYYENEAYDSSVREINNEGGYVITGLTPNLECILEIGMHTHGWTKREIEMYVGGTYANDKITDGTLLGSVESSGNSVQTSTFSVQVDAEGQLLVSFKTNTQGQNALVAYIRIIKPAVIQEEISSTLPTLDPIKVGQAAYWRQSFVSGSEPEIELKNLYVGATVYITDSEERFVDSFVADAATKTWANWEKVKGDACGLNFSQAYYDVEGNITTGNGSLETSVALPRVDFVTDHNAKVIKLGDRYSIIVSPKLGNLPKTVYGAIDYIRITRPDGVVADIINSFFYRTIKNGIHTLTVSCNGVEYTVEFEVTAIETLDVTASYSTEEWTDGDVTLTITPKASEGIQEMFVNGEKVTLTDGSYVITATENGTYTVKLVTSVGSEREYTYVIGNIDKGEATLTMNIDFSVSSGVQFGYDANSVSDGTLYVKKDGGTAEAVQSYNVFNTAEAGKYEFYYESASGKTSQTYTYYVTLDKNNAQLGTVGITDGKVSVSGDNVEAKLYRAGDNTALSELDVSKTGKYYLCLAKGGEKEIVMIDVLQGSADNISKTEASSTPTTTTTSSKNTTDIALTVVFAVLAAAAVAGIVVLVIKRRKA